MDEFRETVAFSLAAQFNDFRIGGAEFPADVGANFGGLSSEVGHQQACLRGDFVSLFFLTGANIAFQALRFKLNNLFDLPDPAGHFIQFGFLGFGLGLLGVRDVLLGGNAGILNRAADGFRYESVLHQSEVDLQFLFMQGGFDRFLKRALKFLALVADNEIHSAEGGTFDPSCGVDLRDENILFDFLEIAIPGINAGGILGEQLPEQRHVNRDVKAVGRWECDRRQDWRRVLAGGYLTGRRALAELPGQTGDNAFFFCRWGARPVHRSVVGIVERVEDRFLLRSAFAQLFGELLGSAIAAGDVKHRTGVRHGDLIVADFDAFDRIGFGVDRVQARRQDSFLDAAFTGIGQGPLRRLAGARGDDADVAGINLDHLHDFHIKGIRIELVSARQQHIALNALFTSTGEEFSMGQFFARLGNDQSNFTAFDDDLVFELAFVQKRIDEMPARPERFL